LRKRGYLEADTQDVVPTGYDPALEEDPELARTMAASMQQRIAFGERAGQKVRRIGSGFGDADERRAELELARLLKRVFSIDMERCPACQQGRLRIIAAITEVNVIQKILRHLKLAADPPPITPAQQAAFAWNFSSP